METNKGLFCAYCDSKIFENEKSCSCCGAPTKSAIYKIDKNKVANKKFNTNIELVEFEQDTMIAGGERVFNFYPQDKFGNTIDLTGSRFLFKIFKYGDPSNILLQKEHIINEFNDIIKIRLLSKDTIDFYGAYIFSVNLYYKDGTQYCLGQGIINIIKTIYDNDEDKLTNWQKIKNKINRIIYD